MHACPVDALRRYSMESQWRLGAGSGSAYSNRRTRRLERFPQACRRRSRYGEAAMPASPGPALRLRSREIPGELRRDLAGALAKAGARRESSFRSRSAAVAASSTRFDRLPSRHAPTVLIRYVTDRADRTGGHQSLHSLSGIWTRRAPNGHRPCPAWPPHDADDRRASGEPISGEPVQAPFDAQQEIG